MERISYCSHSNCCMLSHPGRRCRLRSTSSTSLEVAQRKSEATLSSQTRERLRKQVCPCSACVFRKCHSAHPEIVLD